MLAGKVLESIKKRGTLTQSRLNVTEIVEFAVMLSKYDFFS